MILHGEWGMPPIGDNHSLRDVSTIKEANVHHSDTEPPHLHGSLRPDDSEGCAAQVRMIDRYHRSEGWACIGYNRVICSHGYVYQGRPLHIVPAAAANYNGPIDAICLLAKGNNPATPEQLATLWYIIHKDEQRIGHTLRITTHREVEPTGYTECPGNGIEAQVVKHRRSKK